ncbi:hypothetical protein Vadar_001359 [Vaccinium darrowii]|uniref:Uncharacterized protein n=1 Tax=Vaccinium darrowii TaxID=229202 RepID=A0ACB7YAY4_9ERIC|nr:hypothetical protein Vadar_001359 [Vaccinium darrowii]
MLESTGVKYGSPTLSSAMSNLIPDGRARFKKLKWCSQTLRCLGISTRSLHSYSIQGTKNPSYVAHSRESSPASSLATMELGPCWPSPGNRFSFICIIEHLSAVVRELPGKTTIVFFLCFFRTILSGSFSLIVERNPHAWKLRPDIELIAIIYSGIFGCVVRTGVSTWCLEEKVPVFVAMFKPLGIAIAVVLATLFLGDPLILAVQSSCIVIGAVIIALGFYTVMWGKAKEQKLVPENEISCFESSSERTPLLQNKPKEEM